MTDAAQSLYRHFEAIRNSVSGFALLGDEGSVDVLYDTNKCDRNTAVKSDLKILSGLGYTVRIVGRNRLVAVDLRNVGDSLNARYVK